MAFLKLYCDVCGGAWEVYLRDKWNDAKTRQCPHCQSKIDPELWDNKVIPALVAVHDANLALMKNHTDYYQPLFSFDVEADHLYKNREPADELEQWLQDFDDFLNA